jgi:hypothetical protein
MIAIGKIAVVKTTGERVLVLGMYDDRVEVRRPVSSPNGIQHLLEKFHINELAEPLEYMLSERQELEEFKNAVAPKNEATKLAN